MRSPLLSNATSKLTSSRENDSTLHFGHGLGSSVSRLGGALDMLESTEKFGLDYIRRSLEESEN
jgi:hypothetical protein